MLQSLDETRRRFMLPAGATRLKSNYHSTTQDFKFDSDPFSRVGTYYIVDDDNMHE